MRRTLRPLCGVLLFSILAAAPPLRAADPTYAALRAARPDGRTIPASGLELRRDAFKFHFDEGTFHLLGPVGERTVGAVFLGHGSYTLEPSNEIERRHLALRTGNDKLEILSDTFERLVLLFYDDTAEELQLATPAQAGAPAREATAAFDEAMARLRKPWKLNLHARLLQDLLNSPNTRSGVFLALVDGKSLPPALLVVDPQGIDATRLEPFSGGEEIALAVEDASRGGLWYASHRVGEVHTGRFAPAPVLVDALHYSIDVTVKKDSDLTGSTTVRLKALASGLRVLPLYLLPKLRIRSVEMASDDTGPWTPVAFVQEDEDEDADASLVLPEPLAKGAEVSLRVTYAGTEVLTNAGDGNFVVGARESWYPNFGPFADPATFDLRFRVPEPNQVVSVGELVESHAESGANVSTWKAERPIRVAGFNYGRFKKLERVDDKTGVTIDVFTNPGTPDIVREISAYMNAVNDEATAGGGFDPDEVGGIRAPSVGRVNTERLAESALVDGMNAERVCAAYFGPLGATRVAITQQSQWFFGQSWPGLVFLPYVSFLTGTLREQLGLGGAKGFVDEVGFHELAHQWWGHRVGWKSYRDTWLSEGFAQFSAALALEHTAGWGRYDDHWERARKYITAAPPGSTVPNSEAGPITLGTRLATERTPSAYQALVYYKGAYVLHMLRMLMRDGSNTTQPDAPFIALMQDFATTYAGQTASTADFQRIVEKHIVPTLNATGDGKLDWFFGQWVNGTEIPRLVNELKIEKDGDGYRVRGSLHQEGVNEKFRTLVPVYVDFVKGAAARISVIPLIGTTARQVDVHVALPQKPKRIALNLHHEVLTRD